MSIENEYAAARTSAGFFLTDAGVIDVTGPEARTFLQNLGTCDMRSLAPGGGAELFFTTHKARVIAHAAVLCTADDSFLLTVEDNRTAALYQHLDRHLISEQLELKQTDLRVLRVLGSRAEEMLGQPVDARPWHGRAFEGGFVRRQGAMHVGGVDVLFAPSYGDRITSNLIKASAIAISHEAMEAIRIESGWPRWGHEIDENRFVVELGRPQAVCYTKGCYLGQEPIVMARDRGQVNRQLMGFRAAEKQTIPIGAKVMMGEVEKFKVTSSAYSPAFNANVGLAFVYRGQQTPGATLVVPTPGGDVEATLLSLPMGLV